MASAGTYQHESGPDFQAALALLLKSRSYAVSLDRAAWDFAVEIDRLHSLGLDDSDLRWLVCKGLVEHARETSFPGQEERQFHLPGGLSFDKSTSFVLTEAGEAAAVEQKALYAPADPVCDGIRRSGTIGDDCRPTNGHTTPTWFEDRRELLFADKLVKRYRSPSPNQETILKAFEEEHWRLRIDDPLPPVLNRDSKRRLHDTIVSLNRHQKNRLLRFTGDGTGLGINWEPISD